jgi:hypothetical protein
VRLIAHINRRKVVEKNVGSADKVVRVIIGLGLLSMLFWMEGNAKWWGLIGILPLFTAAIGWCPAYMPFGIKTCKTPK